MVPGSLAELRQASKHLTTGIAPVRQPARCSRNALGKGDHVDAEQGEELRSLVPPGPLGVPAHHRGVAAHDPGHPRTGGGAEVRKGVLLSQEELRPGSISASRVRGRRGGTIGRRAAPSGARAAAGTPTAREAATLTSRARRSMGRIDTTVNCTACKATGAEVAPARRTVRQPFNKPWLTVEEIPNARERPIRPDCTA